MIFTEDNDGNEIQVLGWPEENTEEDQKQWIRDFSDHALLRFSVAGAAYPGVPHRSRGARRGVVEETSR